MTANDDPNRVLTRQEVLEWFENEGIVIAQWAAQNGFKKNTVYTVLTGRTDGRRGESHRVAVALGLKPKPGSSGPIPGKYPQDK